MVLGAAPAEMERLSTCSISVIRPLTSFSRMAAWIGRPRSFIVP